MANPTNPPGPTPNPTPTPPPAPQPAPQPTPAPNQTQQQATIKDRLLTFFKNHWGKMSSVVVVLMTLSLILWRYGWKPTQENQPLITTNIIVLNDMVRKMRVELAVLKASISNSAPTTTPSTNLTRVPVLEETNTVTETSSVSAEKNHKEGVLVSHSTNGVAIKVVADKDSRVNVNIRSDKEAESQNPVHNAHRVVELDATDGRLDTVTGIYKLTNTVYALEKVLFQIPEGWAMQAHAAYPHGMLKVLDEKGNPLGGKLVSGGCMFVQNLSQTIDVKLKWECMKIPQTNK